MTEIGLDQCAVRLLPDEPSAEDSFGSHDRVAHALYELICGAEGGKAIGLRGSWGSGKSTVANLLGARLSEQGAPVDTAYLTFDAWAHRGDPLRRSFLERIVPFILDKGWVDKDSWQKRLARLAFTEEHAEQLAQPHVTRFGAALGAALALTPLGTALLGAYAGDDKVHSTLMGMPVWSWGLAVALLPILVVMVGILSRGPDDELSAIFFQRPPEKILTRTQRAPDPTSIEFGQIFSDLMRSALAGHERQVVIVIDNLDRVDAGEALTVWSTMRTFFEAGSSSEVSWRRKVWLIVPFDQRSIGRLWQQEPLQEEVANAFLEKTFQVQFDVPEPVSSDWKAFLAEQLGSALPEHDADDFRTVYRLFRHVGVRQQPLTPRRIKVFVNRLGALHRLWGDSIPLPLQALYVLVHDQLRDPSSSVTTIELDERTLTIVDSPDWRNHLAALHHNVPTEKALQVLITPQVEEALAVADLDWLREQEGLPGFDDIVERIVEDSHKEWAANEPLTIANTALSIAGLEGEAQGSYSQTWRYLSLATMTVERWPGLSEGLAEGLLLVLSHCPPATKDQLAVRVLVGLGASFRPGDNDARPSDGARTLESLTAGVVRVLEELDSQGKADLVHGNFRVEGDGALYLQVLSGVQRNFLEHPVLAYFVPQAAPSKVTQNLTSKVADPGLVADDARAIQAMSRVEADWSWSELLTSLTQQLSQRGTLPPPQVIGLVVSLLVLAAAGVSDSENAIESLVTEGYLLSHFYDHQAADAVAAGACWIALAALLPDAGPTGSFGNSAAGFQTYNTINSDPENYRALLEAVEGLVRDFHLLDYVLEHARVKDAGGGITSQLLRRLAVAEDATDLYTTDVVRRFFRQMRAAVAQEELKGLLRALVTGRSLLRELIADGYGTELAHLYLLLMEIPEAAEDEGFRDILWEGLEGLSEEDWSKELRTTGVALRLLRQLASVDNRHLSRQLGHALLEHARVAIRENEEATKGPDWLAEIIQVLPPELQETFFLNLRDEVVTHPDAPLTRVVELYGEALIRSGALEEKADDFVRRVFSEILEKGIPAEVEWMGRVVDQRPEIVEQAKRPSAKDFKERLREVALSPETASEILEVVRQVANKLDVDLPSPPVEDEPDEE